jgi:HK97 family phage major capsid protein
VSQKLKDLRGKVETLRKELSTILDEAGPDLDMAKVKHLEGDSTAKVAYFQAINAELDDTMKELEPLEDEHKALILAQQKLQSLGRPRGEGDQGFQMKHQIMPSAEMIAASYMQQKAVQGGFETQGPNFGKAIYEAWVDNSKQKHVNFDIDDIDVKTLMTTSAGWSTPTIRTGRLVDDAQRPIQVIDVIPAGQTANATVVYMEETTFTNAAAELAEAGTFPESALALTEQSSPVRKIATFLPVTDEQLEDIPQVQGYINNRLPFMLRQRLDSQIINGNGTSPNLRGFLNVVGIQTQARGTDPHPDAVYKAMTLVRVTGRSSPSAYMVHPTDWQNVRLLRTADGLYIWGNPSETGIDRIWGLPVVQTDTLTAGTSLVGDFAAYTELVLRRGIEVKISDSHGTFFIEGKQAIRADMRAALVVYRPEAIAKVTGL